MQMDDWDELLRLSDEAGLPTERILALRNRFSVDRLPGVSVILIVGIAETRFIDFLASVLGQTDSERPRGVIVWSIAKGHEESVASRVAQLDVFDLVVLVSRISQPLSQRECNLARSMNGIAATIRVMFLVLPGEEPSTTEIAELRRLSSIKMRQVGYLNGRVLSSEVWESMRAKEGLESATNLQGVDFLRLHAKTGDQAFAAIVREGLSYVEHLPIKPIVPHDLAERLRLQFTGYLEAFESELRAKIGDDQSATVQSVVGVAQKLFHDWHERDVRVKDWRATVEEYWPKVWEDIETLAARVWNETLTIERVTDSDSVSKSPVSSPSRVKYSLQDLILLMPLYGKRLAMALIIALVVPWLISFSPVGNHGMVVTLASTLGLVLGLFGATRFIKDDREITVERERLSDAQQIVVQGWFESSKRIVNLVHNHLDPKKTSLITRWKAFARRLELIEVG